VRLRRDSKGRTWHLRKRTTRRWASRAVYFLRPTPVNARSSPPLGKFLFPHPDVRRGSGREQVPRCCQADVPLPLPAAPYARTGPKGKAGAGNRHQESECLPLRCVDPDRRRRRDRDNVLWRRDSHGKPRRRQPGAACRPAEGFLECLRAAGGAAVRVDSPPKPTVSPRRTWIRRSACRSVSPAFLGCGSARAAAWARGRSRLSAPHARAAKPLARMPTMLDAPGSGASISSTMKWPTALLRIGHNPVVTPSPHG